MSDANLWEPKTQVVDELLRDNLARYDNEEFGAGMIGYEAGLPYLPRTVGYTLNYLMDALGSLPEIVLNGFADIRDYGAVADGETDCSSAIAAALAANDRVLVPASEDGFFVANPIAVASGKIIQGSHPTKSQLIVTLAAMPVLQLPAGSKGTKVSNLTIQRRAAVVTGGNAIEVADGADSVTLGALILTGHHVAIKVGTGWNCKITNTTMTDGGHGVYVGPTISGEATWTISHCVAAYNSQHGYLFKPELAATAVQFGELSNSYAVYNTGYGCALLGAETNSGHSLRVLGGAFSFNGSHNIYLDSYGTRNRVVGASCSGAGSLSTGPRTSQDPATLNGCGIYITANNTGVAIQGATCEGNTLSGVRLLGGSQVVQACTMSNNGTNVNAVVAARSGIHVATGAPRLVGNVCGNLRTAEATQLYGIFLADHNAASVVAGNACTGNTTAQVQNTLGAANANGVVTATVGASPYVFTALTDTDVYLTGGTVSVLSLLPQSLNLTYTAASQNVVRLRAGDQLSITYSAVPTMRIRQFYN